VLMSSEPKTRKYEIQAGHLARPGRRAVPSTWTTIRHGWWITRFGGRSRPPRETVAPSGSGRP